MVARSPSTPRRVPFRLADETDGASLQMNAQTRANPDPEIAATKAGDFHDAEIFAVTHLRSQASLTFGLRTESEDILHVTCTGIAGFALSPFEDQNILFALRTYDASSMPGHLLEDLLPFYRDAIAAGALDVELDASVGLGGWVVAEAVVTTAATPPPSPGAAPR